MGGAAFALVVSGPVSAQVQPPGPVRITDQVRVEVRGGAQAVLRSAEAVTGPLAVKRAAFARMVAAHANANAVPEHLVHRVIMRESKYEPRAIGRGGAVGLMQIKLGTARGMGYRGDNEGLRDPETNLTWAVKYLAGAFRAAEGDADRAVSYYAKGYYGKGADHARLRAARAEQRAQRRAARRARSKDEPTILDNVIQVIRPGLKS